MASLHDLRELAAITTLEFALRQELNSQACCVSHVQIVCFSTAHCDCAWSGICLDLRFYWQALAWELQSFCWESFLTQTNVFMQIAVQGNILFALKYAPLSISLS